MCFAAAICSGAKRIEIGDFTLAWRSRIFLANSGVGLALGELFFEFGFAQGSAVVEGLIGADLLARVPENLLARREAAGSLGGQQVAGTGRRRRNRGDE